MRAPTEALRQLLATGNSMAEMSADPNHIRIAKVIGENEDGMALFVPKNMNGVFELADGDRFLTMMFIHQVGSDMEAWLPWEG